VLIITLWIVAGLAAMALTFGHAVVFGNRISANVLAERQAEEAIAGARRYVLVVLKANETAGDIPDSETYSAELTIGNARAWLLDRPTAGATDLTYGLQDEASKLNLNTATAEMLEALPGMTEDLAAAIIDWRDEDNTPGDGGAEDETYSRKEPDYQTKNSDFETVEELILVNGMTLDLLLGKDHNQNGIVEDSEEEASAANSTTRFSELNDFGLINFLTVHSEEANTDPDGQARININERNTSQLSQTLAKYLEQSKATSVIEKTNAGRKTYTSLVEFFLSSGLSAEDFALIDDYLSVSKEETLSGLVNVNTASTTVLACLPGLDETTAAKLVSYRLANSEKLTSIAWIVEALEKNETALEVGPYLTTRTNRYAADIAAVGQNGRGFKRFFMVIDTSGDEPAVIFRRERTGYGWCLGSATRTELAAAAVKEGN
jgi:DNA uptake protein ComE-like DNA-binding protein